MTPESRSRQKELYERLIGLELGKIQPVNSFGKPIKRTPMPWMLPAWSNGLYLLLQVMEEKKELFKPTIS